MWNAICASPAGSWHLLCCEDSASEEQGCSCCHGVQPDLGQAWSPLEEEPGPEPALPALLSSIKHNGLFLGFAEASLPHAGRPFASGTLSCGAGFGGGGRPSLPRPTALVLPVIFFFVLPILSSMLAPFLWAGRDGVAANSILGAASHGGVFSS